MGKKSNINQSILKVLSIFTSIQMVNMLCSMVKMKFVSIWLEAAGVGLFGIFQVVSDTTATVTDFGLRQSTTREVALLRNNPGKSGRLFATIRSWNLLAGGLGALILSLLSPLLSLLFFNTAGFWWPFVILGLCILLNALTAGENSILQGLSRFNNLARASLLASLTGLAISIPMFRFLGKNSVILSLMVYAICGYYYMYRNRPKDFPSERPSRKLLKEGTGFAKLGGYMAVAAFVSSLSVTAFVGWLNRYADTAEVGYFQAGNTLVIRYMGFVLSAIGLEFYPRIASCARSTLRQSIFVTHEMALTLNILTPLVLLFLLFRPLLIEILYTSQFEVILPFVTVGIIHTIFRTPSTVIAYTIVSRGNGLLYLMIELTDAIIGLTLCILSYRYWGLTGIGFAYIAWYIFYLSFVWIIAGRKFGIRVGRGACKALVSAVLITVAGGLLVWYAPVYIYLPVILAMIIPYLLRLKTTLKRR